MTISKAGYDWLILFAIAAFWIGGLVFNYFLASVVTRRGFKQPDKTDT